jgi:putative PIN family toxin of toxin-antitoxin system
MVVWDVNVLIPLMVPASLSSRLLERQTALDYRIAITPLIWEDVRRKLMTKESLRRWLGAGDEDVAHFLAKLLTICTYFPGNVKLSGVVVDDPDDDRIFAAAIESGAETIVSEDKHLLRLSIWHGIQVVTRQDFFRALSLEQAR